jgi:hypothetical protein
LVNFFVLDQIWKNQFPQIRDLLVRVVRIEANMAYLASPQDMPILTTRLDRVLANAPMSSGRDDD